MSVASCTSSWFDGLEADLAWMRNVGAYPEHEGIADLDAAIAMWSAPSPTAKATWKAMLRTTLRRHLQQEQTIHETFGLQRGILRILSQHGASFSPDPREQVAREATFACFCGKLFTTGQGLASHKRLQHGGTIFGVRPAGWGNLPMLSTILLDDTKTTAAPGLHFTTYIH